MSSDRGPTPAWNYDRVHERLTRERLATYLLARGGDVQAGFELYEWNIEASASVLSTVAMAEVVVRNALDEQLRIWAATRGARSGRQRSWLDMAPLDEQGRNDVDKARRYAQRTTSVAGRRRSATSATATSHGKVVAELNLGFWRYLTASRYLTDLWIPALHEAFPDGPAGPRARRAAVEDRLQRLLVVRNRAAHHEPIFRRNLQRDLDSAVEVTRWISHDCADWLSARSTITAVLAARPTVTPPPIA